MKARDAVTWDVYNAMYAVKLTYRTTDDGWPLNMPSAMLRDIDRADSAGLASGRSGNVDPSEHAAGDA